MNVETPPLTCRRADSFFERLRGLLGRDGLEPGQGLLIKTSAVHTCFMRFPIDVVFVDRDWRVVKTATLPPWRMAFASGAARVLEIKAGEAKSLGLVTGTTLLVTEQENALQIEPVVKAT